MIFPVLFSCSGNESREQSPTDTRDQELINPIQVPVLGVMDVADNWTDSTHAYGGGDCFGRISHYTKGEEFYATDSMTCGEYGFTFRHYRFSDNGTISYLREFKWESVINMNADKYIHIMHEYVYDLGNESPLLLQRTDTVPVHYIETGFPVEISKPFVRHDLEVTSSLLGVLRTTYEQTWQRELISY